MKPRLNPESSRRDLFRASFDEMLNPEHPLVVLAGKIDWDRFEVAMAECYSPDLGAPARATRLMVGRLIRDIRRKHTGPDADLDSLLALCVRVRAATSHFNPSRFSGATRAHFL